MREQAAEVEEAATLGSPVKFTDVSFPLHMLSTGCWVPFRDTSLWASLQGRRLA